MAAKKAAATKAAPVKKAPAEKAAAPAAPAKKAAPAKPAEVARELGSRALTLGDQGPDVAYIQALVGVEADGVYGDDTARAVRRWHKTRGRHMSGDVTERDWRDIKATL